jgi:ubiquinol-cytochrome c reductase cytochrome c subunit
MTGRLSRVLRHRALVPAALLVVVGLGGVLSFASAASAQGSGLSSLNGAGAEGTAHSPVAPTQPVDTGTSNASLKVYSHGKLVAYGNNSIRYTYPSSRYVPAGQALFEEFCSSCHGTSAVGTERGPNLVGLGPATIDFWVSTGRMPAENANAVQAPRKPARLSDFQAIEIASFVNSLDPSEPAIPVVNTKGASISTGAQLFALNCAACHTITGAGDELAYSTYAPSLRAATPTQVAEAIRTGPANMPRFTGNLTDAQVRDIVAFVTEDIQHASNPGGFALGGVGPVAEGFVALLFGVGGLALVGFWIGDRS